MLLSASIEDFELALGRHLYAAHLLTGQGSHMLSGLALADVLVEIPAGSPGTRAGARLQAVKLDWEK